MHTLFRALFVSPVPAQRKESSPDAAAEMLEQRVMLANGNLTAVTNTDAFPNSAVVQLQMTWDTNNNGVRDAGDFQSQCSGSLIGDYHVLTAAHCVYDRGAGTDATGGLGYADWIQVFPGRNGGYQPFGVANAVELTVPDLWENGTTEDYNDGDIALITLDRSVGAFTGQFGMVDFTSPFDPHHTLLGGTDLGILHYPGVSDFGFDGEDQYFSGEFRVRSATLENFSYSLLDAWTTGGSSGSPIFASNVTVRGVNYQNVVVGVISRGDFVPVGVDGEDIATRVDNWLTELQTWMAADAAPTELAALYDYDDWFEANTSSVSAGTTLPPVMNVDQSGTIYTSARVFNGGTVAANNVTVRFYISEDAAISPTADTYIGQDVISINPYEYVTANWSGALPASIESGAYYIGWTIDEADVIAEYDEGQDRGFHSQRLIVNPRLITDIYEDNDSYAAAYNFGATTGIFADDLSIDATGDDDYYTFTVFEDGTATVSIDHTRVTGDLDLEVYTGPDATYVAASRTTADRESVTFNVTAGTTYYVRVNGYEGAVNDYSLTIDAPDTNGDALETNDTLAQATALPDVAASMNVTYSNSDALSIHTTSDDDWFVFNVTAPSADVTIDITFLHAVGNIDLELYEINGTQTLLDSSTSITDDESITRTLAPGQYAIRVYGHSGATNLYNIDFRAVGAPTGAPLTDIIGRTDGGDWWVGQSNGSQFNTLDFGNWSGTWTDTQYADFNNDGFVDVAGRASDGRWHVGLSNGTQFTTSVWSRWSVTATFTDFGTGDFNGDDQMDIVGRSINFDGRSTWWVGISTGSGFVTRALGTWGDQGWQDTQYADFDGDGITDIASRTATEKWVVGLSNGTRLATSLWERWSTSATWSHVSSGDFNNDGRADIVGQTQTGAWWVSLSGGSSFTTTAWGRWTETNLRNVMVADFNGDGTDDILARSTTGYWRIGLSNGSRYNMQTWARWNDTNGWRDISYGDFNGDGRMDIVGRNSAGTIWVGVSEVGRFNSTAFGTWPSNVALNDTGAANFA